MTEEQDKQTIASQAGHIADRLSRFAGFGRVRGVAVVVLLADRRPCRATRTPLAAIRAFDHAIVIGHPEDAPDHLGRAEDGFHAFRPAMQALYGVAWVQLALAAGGLDGAAQTLERPLEILRTTTDHSYLLSLAQGTAALLRARAGDPSALELAAEAVAATRRFPVPLAVVMALARAADAAVLLGRPDDARPLIVELVDALRQLGTRRFAAEAHELAAIVLGDDQPAAAALGAADRLRADLGEYPGLSRLPEPSKRLPIGSVSCSDQKSLAENEGRHASP